ncbi:MAG: hypothetical protein U0271_09980 [Polyangiaceae bacterium]
MVLFAPASALVGCSVDTAGIFGDGDGNSGGSGAASQGGDGNSGGAATGGDGSGGAPPPGCGDGVKSATEDCDGTDLGGATCADYGYSGLAGLSCSANCHIVSEGCQPTCDGNLLEPGEECDGFDLGGASCSDYGFTDPSGLACQGCTLDPSGCAPTCGDDVAEPGEACDGQDLNGQDCTDLGFTNPNGAACLGDCSGVDSSGCQATCNGVLEPGEECDGNTSGHDCTEYGYVKPSGLACVGCALDPSGCQPTCGNFTQEPGEDCDDGNTQPGDGCSATCQLETPTGTTCASAIPVALSNGSSQFTGTTVNGGQHGAGGCQDDGADILYAVTPASAGFLTASLERGPTDFDSVLWLSQGCNDQQAVTQLLCADSYDASSGQSLDGGEVVSIPVQAGMTYYVVVDGWAQGVEGNYKLTLDLSSGRECSDPVPIPLSSGTPMPVLGNNNGGNPSALGSCGGSPGEEIIYAISRTGGVTVDTTNGTNYNSVLYTRSTCNNPLSESSCSNNQGTAMESVSLTNLSANTPVFLYVDGSQAGGGSQTGNYSLTLTPN